MTNPWCSDPARDEFIRAAEDGRKGRLPTLEECIERVTERRPVDAGGGGNVTGFADQAKCSPAVSETGEGQSGLRAERVTLECVHRFGKHPSLWDWWRLMEPRPGESVRVVDHGNDWKAACESARIASATIADITAERDAAIRERDALRAERITQALTADRFASAVAEADKLRARVAELESAAKLAPAANADVKSNHAAPAASGAAGTEPVAWGFVAMDGVIVHVSTFEPVPGTATVVPLYAAPPPANGWLTAEERRLIEGMMESASAFPPTMHWHSGCTVRDTLRILQSILSRSSPPEVVFTEVFNHFDSYGDRVAAFDADHVRKALAAAGVKVKEVGSE